MESFEERYGTKSEVTRYRVDYHGVRKLSGQNDKGLVITANRFIKVSNDYIAQRILNTVIYSSCLVLVVELDPCLGEAAAPQSPSDLWKLVRVKGETPAICAADFYPL